MQRRQSFYNATDFTRCECAKSCKIRLCDPSRLASSAKWRAVRPSAAPVWGSTPRSRRIRRIGTSPICAATWMGYINSKRTFPGEASRKKDNDGSIETTKIWNILQQCGKLVARDYLMWIFGSKICKKKDMKEIEHTSSWSLSITALQPGCGIPSPVFRDSHDLAKRPSRIRIYSSVEEQPQWLFFNRAKK